MHLRYVCSLVAVALTAVAAFGQAPIDVLTQHQDNARTGAQLHETILKPSNVKAGSFGRVYERYVDGQIIAQPLYVTNQSTPGKGVRNVVYVTTRKNRIYAFDADSTDPDPTHGLLWTAPVQIDRRARYRTCVQRRAVRCTPAIDRAAGTLYAMARKADSSIWLHALDISTGAHKSPGPGAVRIAASVVNSSGQSMIFNESLELNRAGLLLQNGALYLAFSALNCDDPGWRGWIFQCRLADLKLTGSFVTVMSSGADGGGEWQSGNGLVADGLHNIYFATGNGPVSSTDFGESFIKLHAGSPPSYGLILAGHYTVSNFAALNGGDTDMGSGGPGIASLAATNRAAVYLRHEYDARQPVSAGRGNCSSWDIRWVPGLREFLARRPQPGGLHECLIGGPILFRSPRREAEAQFHHGGTRTSGSFRCPRRIQCGSPI
jgi:hypothetical protein